MSTTLHHTQTQLELLTWHSALDRQPDDDTTVLMHHGSAAMSEPVWPGYLDTIADVPPSTARAGWHTSEGMPIDEPDHWATMPAGPAPTTAAENLEAVARQLVEHASRCGLVLTIEQRPLQPLAQGHHETVVSVREVRR